MMNNSNHSSTSTDTGSGYASDREDDSNTSPEAMSESFSSYLNGMFGSDDEEDDTSSTTSKEIMPPPPRAFTSRSSSSNPTSSNTSSDDGNSTPPAYAAEGEAYTSCSPLTSSGSESPPSSDEERWELHYLNKKRRLLTRAIKLMSRDEVYDASMASSFVHNKNKAFESPLWMEAKKMAGYTKRQQHSSMHQRASLLGTKRPRIDLSSVYHVKGDIHKDLFTPQLCTVEHKTTENVKVAAATTTTTTPTPVSVISAESSVCEEKTMDLARAIAFSPVAQILAQAGPPFTIVHANRAFSEFSGLETGQVVGHSLRAIVTSKNDNAGACTPKAQDTFVDAEVATASSPSSTHRKCVMRTVLVKDAPSHKPAATTFGTSEKRNAPAVTHVLVQVKSPAAATPDAVPVAPVRSILRKRSNSRVIEAVG